MTIEIRVPTLGESVTEATIATWFKKTGDRVATDEMLCELETDKVTVEVPSPTTGVLTEIIAAEGATVGVGALLATLDDTAGATATPPTTLTAVADPVPPMTSAPMTSAPVTSTPVTSTPVTAPPKAAATTTAATTTASATMTGTPETVDVMVPTLGESVTEATVATWLKKPGEAVAQDEMLCELETDKVSVEVPAPAAGVLAEILAPEGTTVEAGGKLAVISASGGVSAAQPTSTATAAPGAPTAKKDIANAPSAEKLMAENNISPASVQGTGRDGRIMKEDVQNALTSTAPPPATTIAATAIAAIASAATTPPSAPRAPAAARQAAREERVKMTRLRQTIARRLKEAQNSAAMLTTYNEIDMSAIMDLRTEYKELFAKKHGVKLGFMSFFAKACIHALFEVPDVNAEIDGTDIIYKNYVNMGVAVGTPTGLVVPVVRDADQMSFAGIEKAIAELGARARDGKLTMGDMQGGSFTISNGGVYGSLMSSPILNPPQSGILGMHKIQQRPVAIDGQVVIRPMMYLALSYDHRVVDGKGAVTFLVRVKESLEDPRRLLMDL